MVRSICEGTPLCRWQCSCCSYTRADATCYRCIFISIKEVRSTNKHQKDWSTIPTRYRPSRGGGDPSGWDSPKPGRWLHLPRHHYIQRRTHRLWAGEKNVKGQQCLWKTANQAMEQPSCEVQNRAIVLSTLLYGAESWTLYKSQVKKLHAFMMRHLRAIMRIIWKDNVTNKEVLERANLPSMEDLLIRRNLPWTGHVIRMPSERLPKQVLFSQLPAGERGIGRPQLCYKDTIKRNLKRRQIEIKTRTTAAGQRAVWRTAVKWTWRRSLSLRDRQLLLLCCGMVRSICHRFLHLKKGFIVIFKCYDYRNSDKAIYIWYTTIHILHIMYILIISTPTFIRYDIAIHVGENQCRPKMKRGKNQMLWIVVTNEH